MRSHERKGVLALFLLLSFSSCLAVAGEPTTQRKSPAKIDYVAKLNELVKKGSDESLNADPFYRKAFALYVESPTPVDGKEIVCWPTELADGRCMALKKWVEANSEALAQLRLGAQKPSCWFYYKGSHILETDRLQDMPKVRLLLWALVLRAKCEATNGDIEGALNDLVASWRFTGDVRKRLLLMEQVTGIAVSVCAFRAGLQILDKSHLNSFQMESLKNGLMSLLKDRGWFIDLKAEEFATQDALQRLYAQWPGSGSKENTRPVDEAISAMLSAGLKADYGMELSAEQVYSSVYRYTPEAMATLIGEAFAFYSSLVSKTPFQWHQERVS